MLSGQVLRKLGNKSQIELSNLAIRGYRDLGPVPRERPVSVNPRLKFCSVFVFYIPMHCLGNIFVSSLLYLVVTVTVFCNLELHVLKLELNRA